MKDKVSIFVLLAALVNTVPRYFPPEYEIVYFVGQALSFVLLLIALLYLTTGIPKIVCQFVLWLAISNLLDEMFFDPLKLGLNELCFTIFIVGWTIVKLRKWRKGQL